MSRATVRAPLRIGPRPDQRRVTYALVSALLRYPDDALVGDLADLAAAVRTLSPPAAVPLRRVVDHLGSAPLLDLQVEYVATFDLRRRCCLYLSYYLNGDTRRRGAALWRFADVYKRAGITAKGGELPDYLPMVLELAASGGEREAVGLLQEHRAAIRLLLGALEECGSPYAGAVRALEAVLPPSRAGVDETVERLAFEGPPSELVGLDPGAAEPYTSSPASCGGECA